MDYEKRYTRLILSVFLVLTISSTLKGGSGSTAQVIMCKETDRQALLKFKQGVEDEYDVLWSWGSEESKRECCKWRGVGCSNITGHVTSLHLNGKTLDQWHALRGNLSNSLVDLSHLISLDLSTNDFYPNEIPGFIGSLDKLMYLNLSHCSLIGKVPVQLGNLTNLRTLDLGNNYGLMIRNLDWLSNLSSLSHLDFGGSSFTDGLRTIVFKKILIIHSLKELYLQGCRFPNDTSSSVDIYVNSTFASLSVLALSATSLTSSNFHNWLFSITTSLVSLDLSSNHLDGPIPDEFGQKLVSLENLDLSNNRFEGGIPKSLWNLKSLKVLDLSRNKLTESLPDFVGTMVQLEILDLSYNRITGSVPESFWQASKLRVLRASFNSLEGTILESHLSKLHDLKTLDLTSNSLVLNLTTVWDPPFQLEFLMLASCKMGPRFPTWVLTQSKVSQLDLSCANISDELPEWFWDSLPRLEFLNLSHNQIGGRLPDLSLKLFGHPYIDLSFNEFSGLIPPVHSNTTSLYLSNNKFFGTISFMCKSNFEYLSLLDLSNNQLFGQIPNCWENILLDVLDLSNNNFSGKIPNFLGYVFDILHLGNNNLSGELPYSLSTCQSLSVLDVGGNKLTGNIPAWIGTNLARLVIFSIRGNNFFGNIPPEICYLRQIQIIDLSKNNLSGRIPLHCLKNFTAFVKKNSITPFSELGTSYSYPLDHVTVDKIVVQWKGQEFEYSKTLYLLTLIDLSSNKIEGNIPKEIFQMEGLVSLNLSRNHLRGSIDPEIRRMESLESLDLSQNQLSGEIPIGLGTLHFLAFLDLSNNFFSGKIPSSTQLQGFNASRYGGNIGLCGSPLPRCPEDDPNLSSSDHGNLGSGDENDDAFTNQSFLKEFYITIVFGFIVGFWVVIGTLILKGDTSILISLTGS